MLLDLDCVRMWRKMFVAMYDATVDNVPTVRQKEVVKRLFNAVFGYISNNIQ